jgi:tRNA(fMet)-specific endonuclease VapC
VKFLLDTNICIALIKRRPEKALRRLSVLSVGDIGLSAVTLAELQYGVGKSVYKEKNEQALKEFLIPLVVADFDAEAAEVYGQVRSDLEKKGTPIGSLDTLIGAHALSLDLTLVTNNLREFRRIAGLKVVDWTV